MKMHLALLSIGLTSIAHASDLDGIRANNKGVEALQDKRTNEAYTQFSNGLANLPFSSALHYNLGLSFLVNQDYEKALSEFSEAAKLAPEAKSILHPHLDKQLAFMSLFNAGVAATGAKKTDEALMYYQKALSVKPDSVETKKNIELLTKQDQGGGGGSDKDDKKDQSGQQDKNDKGSGKDQKDQKDPKDPKDGKDKKDDPKNDKDQKNQQPQKFDNPRPTPKPFDSKQLNQQDVKQILDELKRQEEQVRARMQDQGAKDAPPDKDW